MVKSRVLAIWVVGLFFSSVSQVGAVNYYVDSASGNDSVSCQQAQSQSTPKRSVAGVNSCGASAGDTIYFRGTFSETINPSGNGQVIQATTNIARVSGSFVEFSVAPGAVSAQTDYVTVYGSRRGNSGAFKVVSVSGNQVTVDTSALPAGSFITESASDPGDLQAAVIRPLHYTAWDKNNPPTWNGSSAMVYSYNRPAVMFSYLRSTAGANNEVWGALYFDGGNNGNNDYIVIDHVEIQNAATAIGLSNNDFHANYAIIQHNTFKNMGFLTGVSDEVIYWGNFLQYQKHHDYPQIMYNFVGPQKQFNVDSTSGRQAVGDGIEVKASGHFPTIFGNTITGMYLTNGCDDAPIHNAGQNAFIANNIINNANSSPNNVPSCAISIVEGAQGANGSIVANNVISNIKGVGIRIFNTSNVQVLNNTINDVHPIQGCCAEESAGIMIQTDGQPALNNVIRNNIIQNVPVGIGRYPWATSQQFSVTTSNNIVYNATTPWGVGITPSNTDRVINPNLINVGGGNFSIGANSPAVDAGFDASALFSIDSHITTLNSAKVPFVSRVGSWDVGAYEVGSAAVPTPSPQVSPLPTPSPSVSPSQLPSPSPSLAPSPSQACLRADLNQDGAVNAADRTLLLADFFKRLPTTVRADINTDGVVDLSDYSLLVSVFGQSCQ